MLELSNSYYLNSELNGAVWYQNTDRRFVITVYGRGLTPSSMYFRAVHKSGIEIIKQSIGANPGILYLPGASGEELSAELLLNRSDIPPNLKIPGTLNYSLQIKDDQNLKFEIDNGVINLSKSNIIADW